MKPFDPLNSSGRNHEPEAISLDSAVASVVSMWNQIASDLGECDSSDLLDLAVSRGVVDPNFASENEDALIERIEQKNLVL